MQPLLDEILTKEDGASKQEEFFKKALRSKSALLAKCLA
jgi:hypothetical protein